MKKQSLKSGNSSNVGETQHDDNLDVANNEENLVEEELSPDLIEASDDQSNSRSERKRKKSKKKRLKREQDDVVQESSLATIEEKEESCEDYVTPVPKKKLKIHREVATWTKKWSDKESFNVSTKSHKKAHELGDFIEVALKIKRPFPKYDDSLSNKNTIELIFGPLFSTRFAKKKPVDIIVQRFIKYCHNHHPMELPDLNVCHISITPPRREVTDRLKREFPSFRTGRFSDEEDFEIQKHLGMLMFELEYDNEKMETLLELLAHSRPAFPARLYLGAVLGQRDMLERRLASDIYNRLLALIRASRRLKVFGNKAFIKELIRESEEAKQPVGKVIQSYQLHLQVSKKSLNNFITKIKAKKDEEDFSKGRFSPEETEQVLRQVLSLYPNLDLDSFETKTMDWKKIGEAVKRGSRSTRLHFTSVIVPAIKNSRADREIQLDWAIEIFKYLVNNTSIKCRQDINWKELSTELDLPISKLDLIYSNRIRRVLQKNDGSADYRDILEQVLDNLQTKKGKCSKKKKEPQNSSDLIESLRSIYLRRN